MRARERLGETDREQENCNKGTEREMRERKKKNRIEGGRKRKMKRRRETERK